MYSRLLRCTLTSLALVASIGAAAGGCLSRPVVPGEPVTKTNFTTDIQEQAVDKLDILFTIDNSASMGDKQQYLEAAIPDLINRLINPYCLDVTGVVQGSSTNTPVPGTCPAGQTVEFPPVHDMHIGIVSSSLGPRLSDQYESGSGVACPTTGPNSIQTINGDTVQDHNDDQGHLLSRSSTPATQPVEAPLPDAQTENFLAWYPAVAANTSDGGPVGVPAITNPATLETDFSDLVAGVHQYGCGIESQLESWYRFLIQPDPYASLTFNSGGFAQWVGVDTTILQQRKDFLRPDSLVAVIVLTDENDSEIDVRSLGGQGYLFMSQAFQPPHGTSICATSPGDPTCQSCNSKTATDPACTANGGKYTSPEDWGFDLNLRHVHMKAKYGLDPQFPIERYSTGLTSTLVPDRNGEYPTNATSYQGQNDCQNPLFAATLPDPSTLSSTIATTISATDAATLCNKGHAGTRAANLIFFAIIGGVPYQFLNYDKTTGISTLGDSDWVKILGNDPETYDYTGIDTHMVESYQPRAGLSSATPTPAINTDPDPINGREWVTNVGPHTDLNVDREYACIFPLTTPRDCTQPNNKLACDCTAPPNTLTPDEISPVCDATNVQQQDFAKAYPTIRELLLAHKLGTQGIASSICPEDVADNAAENDPLYGYRPAVASIINRLKNALTNQCLPQKLTPDSTGAVPCLILATLPGTGDESACNAPGLTVPDPTVLAQFRQTEEAAFLANGGVDAGLGPDPNSQSICQVTQVLEPSGGSCKGGASDGWCYVTGTAAGTCSQAILFTTGTPPTGSKISLQCIEESSVGGDAGQ